MNLKLLALFIVFSASILSLRLFFFFTSTKSYPDQAQISFITRLDSEPKITSQGQRLSIALPNYQRAILNLSAETPVHYADSLRIEGVLEYVKLKDGDEIAIIDDPEFSLVKSERKTNLIYIVRENIISQFNSSFGPREASLMLGIVFGIKEEMPKDFEDKLRSAGLMHVIAASGMNITMVGGFLASIFSFFFRRQVALGLSIGGIVLYAVFAGLEASIVRAAVMGILVFGAQIVGRQNSAYWGLYLAGFIMLFINPSLLFDIGFQLSFLATFGLVFFRPVFYLSTRIKNTLEKSIIGEDLATTLTAQIWTLPILLFNFGAYSPISVIVNAIVLWCVPILMIIGAISAFVGLLSVNLGAVISYLALPFLLYIEKMVEIFSSLGPQISVTSFPLLLVCGYYFLIFGISLKLLQFKIKMKLKESKLKK